MANLLPVSGLVMSHVSEAKIAICTQNFDQIFQSTAEILLLPVSENNGRHIKILLPVSILAFNSYRRLILHWLTKFYPNWTEL